MVVDGIGDRTWHVTIKHMIPAKPKTDHRPARREISAGILVFRRTSEGLKYLILYHGHGYWNFPKGKIESEEKSFETALRETQEETGLAKRDLHIANNFKTYERFTFRRKGQRVFKIVIFYLAETRNPRVRISKEHQGYAWFTFREGMEMLKKYHDSQRVLEQANQFLAKVSQRERRERQTNTNVQRTSVGGR